VNEQAAPAKLTSLKRHRRPRRGRSQIHAFIADDVHGRVKAYCARRGLSECSVIEVALTQHLDQATDAALIMRRLDRTGRRIDKIRADLELLTEFVSLWVRLWFAHTPQIADAQKGAAQTSAAKRYEQFLTYVSKRLASPHRLAIELLGEELLVDGPEPPSPDRGEA
jgi:hypothetical protein